MQCALDGLGVSMTSIDLDELPSAGGSSHEGYRTAWHSDRFGDGAERSLCSPSGIRRFDDSHDEGAAVFAAHCGLRRAWTDMDLHSHIPTLYSRLYLWALSRVHLSSPTFGNGHGKW